MTPSMNRTAIVALLFSLAIPAWGEQYLLYAPQPAASGQKPSNQDGILVQEIEVKKGDTLYGISRKFSGHGMYFPQILLFNSIKKPNLIYPGSILKIPVGQAAETSVNEPSEATDKQKVKTSPLKKSHVKASTPLGALQPVTATPSLNTGTELSLNELKSAGTERIRKNRTGRKSANIKMSEISRVDKATTTPLRPAHKSADTIDITSGQKLFEAAVKAYRRDDCRTALELLDRYLADNAGSPMAADANLYKAECYLKLSAQ